MARVFAVSKNIAYELRPLEHAPNLSLEMDGMLGIPTYWWPTGRREIDVWPLPMEGVGLVFEERSND